MFQVYFAVGSISNFFIKIGRFWLFFYLFLTNLIFTWNTWNSIRKSLEALRKKVFQVEVVNLEQTWNNLEQNMRNGCAVFQAAPDKTGG
jgi:hypothetical protein